MLKPEKTEIIVSYDVYKGIMISKLTKIFRIEHET